MKWSQEQVEDLKALCLDGTKNSEIAEYFGVPVTEIHAKRSQLGITIPKINAMKGRPGLTVKPDFEAAAQEMDRDAAKRSKGFQIANTVAESCFETFVNAGDLCIVLARTGRTALIMRMICHNTAAFVVPLEHVPGETSWWQGNYFDDLGSAWAYYQDQIKEDDPE